MHKVPDALSRMFNEDDVEVDVEDDVEVAEVGENVDQWYIGKT